MDYGITFDNVWTHLILLDPVRPCLSLLNPVWLSLSNVVTVMGLDFLFWTWSMKRSYYTGVNLYVLPCNQYRGSQTLTLFDKYVSSSLHWVLTSRPSYMGHQDQTGSNSAKLEPTWPCNCFHMNLRMMDEKLKLNKEKMKQIYGTGLRFEIHGTGYRVWHIDWHLCSNCFSLISFKRGSLIP